LRIRRGAGGVNLPIGDLPAIQPKGVYNAAQNPAIRQQLPPAVSFGFLGLPCIPVNYGGGDMLRSGKSQISLRLPDAGSRNVRSHRSDARGGKNVDLDDVLEEAQ
jgi:hypothetical protein